ncbi:phosphoribosyltransferase domain-containing protein [uncultured Jatrophihabitans sp.]|uniref:phosphoribosyltransferase domain-containing protein n=1 Tax=uncultured Jatrophihabitans sp. TaxID=1610747 RepID=UPI0035CA559E
MTEVLAGWVGEHFGVALRPDADAVVPLDHLVEVALRRNPRRAQLLVSTVLGKHVPAPPAAVHGSGLLLGELVAKELDGRPAAVLGFAETATGLGHCVAEALDAYYLHSTRRVVGTARSYAGFEEEHSHATQHRLLPADGQVFGGAPVLVLVDDELSTGRTLMNTIRSLHAVAPRERYVVAALVDLRGADDRASLERFAEELGVPVDVVALATGTVHLPPGFAEGAAGFVARHPVPVAAADDGPGAEVVEVRGWPVAVEHSGRHGFDAAGYAAARAAADALAAGIDPVGSRVLVLGTEELMYAPVLIGLALDTRPDIDVRVSSTTRSPVLALDVGGYPIRNALTFTSHDRAEDGPGARFAYNVADGFDDIVVVVDADGDTPALRAGLVTELARVCRRVHVAVLPGDAPLPQPLRGPGFGSYAADDVAWLLTDLSDVALEAPVEEREEAIQSGGAHYAESLPVEYQPDAAYRALFEQALDDAAGRSAHAVGTVTELVLAERGTDVVLASLARAGTPVGVLMRRWARTQRDLDLAHFAVSIVRGRGIDTTALRYLAHHHDPAGVVFVDGWTGKGAIARELAAAVTDANALLGTAFDADLAVLADPGACVSRFGTREDFLIPSACLNSTVSGLVSRTVLNDTVLAPGQFHGAKFYRELTADDVSGRFLDAVSARFADVAPAVRAGLSAARTADRTPTWAGWAQVERLSTEYGIGDVTLVKPGVGETTRVLLRRVPWAVLVRTGAELPHVRLLAAQRGVPVHEVDDLTYSCVGLIHPRYTRGATGAGGTTVT